MLMTRTNACFFLLLALSLVDLAFAQNPPALLVVPSKVTMLVGESHTFRAVGKDGRIRHNVRWSVSPEHAAKLTIDGDEATINAVEPSSAVVLTAFASGDTAEASIEIRSGRSLSTGTTIWSVSGLPGCKAINMTQAVPTANGPDIYVEESCPQGTFIRAMTADGRELWRRRMGGPATPSVSEQETNGPAQPSEHLNLSGHAFCDAVSSGMTKDAVSKLAQTRNLRLVEKEIQNDSWTVEEHGSRCTVVFNEAGTVVKKKKTLVTD
jgi:hypothetical protein